MILPGIKPDEETSALLLTFDNSRVRLNRRPMPGSMSVEGAIKLCCEVQHVRRGIPTARKFSCAFETISSDDACSTFERALSCLAARDDDRTDIQQQMRLVRSRKSVAVNGRAP